MNPIRYFLESLDFLDWWLLAAVLGIADVFLLRGWLVIAAIAAGNVAFLLMLFPQIGWPWQLAVFLVITTIGIAIRRVRGTNSTSSIPTISVIQEPNMNSFYDFQIKTIDGQVKSLKDYKGKAVLVVNVASQCGLTPQYDGLEKLQREFENRGFTVLGLPCNQFGQQEPGTETQIKQFCSVNYNVTFPLTSKIDVNGATRHPLYQWLIAGTGGADIQWNFEKFLIGKDGRIVKRYSPKTVPEDQQLRTDVQTVL